MCSRYFLDADGNIIAYTFRVPVNELAIKRYNIAPTQDAPVVRLAKDGTKEVAMLRWGLVPFWAKDLAVGTKMINARCEGIAEKPAFRQALEKRRCIVPATGFYEWRGERGRKQPYAVTFPDHPVFGFAGLWERWHPTQGEPVDTFTIVTTDANATVARIHDRMPVVLTPGQADAWLSGDSAQARALLRPYEGATTTRAVGRLVSNVRSEGPDCLDDAEPSWGSQPKLF
jgi:putative SOS response-associated peptidase YedK